MKRITIIHNLLSPITIGEDCYICNIFPAHFYMAGTVKIIAVTTP